ncbi:hypothetical protein FRC00_001980 [Tulasnella sp. 408]|nr:hypothetical protein FRC00_001980 [Tulasnella sp. 408]
MRIKRDQPVSDNNQQERAYDDWADDAVNGGIGGVINYQHGQDGQTPNSDSSKRSIAGRQQQHHNAGSDSQGKSPNDGYRISKEGIKNIFRRTGKAQKEKSGRDSD